MVAGTPEFAAVGAVPQFGATEDIGEPQACVMAEARTSRNRKGNGREFLMPDLLGGRKPKHCSNVALVAL
jgi:hypothetical protein